MSLLSAHKQGVGHDHAAENTLEGISRAAKTCDYVEFDVQRCGDGTFVLHHDGSVLIDGEVRPIEAITHTEFVTATGTTCTLSDVCETLRGRAKAHVDLKFTSPKVLYATPLDTYEVEAAHIIVSILGEKNAIITTTEDATVKAVRAWSTDAAPELLVGLSLGKIVTHLATREQLKVRISEAFPARRLRKCHANLIVANKVLASISLVRFATRHNFPVLVWTVDNESELKKWLRDDRVWMVTTNFPELARRNSTDDMTPTLISVPTEDPE